MFFFVCFKYVVFKKKKTKVTKLFPVLKSCSNLINTKPKKKCAIVGWGLLTNLLVRENGALGTIRAKGSKTNLESTHGFWVLPLRKITYEYIFSAKILKLCF